MKWRCLLDSLRLLQLLSVCRLSNTLWIGDIRKSIKQLWMSKKYRKNVFEKIEKIVFFLQWKWSTNRSNIKNFARATTFVFFRRLLPPDESSGKIVSYKKATNFLSSYGIFSIFSNTFFRYFSTFRVVLSIFRCRQFITYLTNAAG